RCARPLSEGARDRHRIALSRARAPAAMLRALAVRARQPAGHRASRGRSVVAADVSDADAGAAVARRRRSAYVHDSRPARRRLTPSTFLPMRIDIYGLGYVGSVSAACLADAGHDVCGIDIDPNKVACINAGKSPVREPGLPEHIAAAVECGRLHASSTPPGDAAVSMVCVGTPSNENGSLRLDYLQRTMEDIGDALARRDSYHVVCIRSTVLPGTTECVAVPILEQHSGKKVGRDFGVCMNPEFLREGSSIQDYRCPPFTIIGELDPRSGERLAVLYDNIPAALFRTKLRVAEMVKYAANVYHALKITFANELGVLCKRLGLDSREVFRIFCEDKKLNISAAYLQPGFAFGGSCLPKDLRAILYKAKELDVEPAVLQSSLAH